MAVRKEYKGIEDFIKAIQSSTVREVFVYELTAREAGENVSRMETNDEGQPTGAVIVPSQKISNVVLLSAEDLKVFGTIKENYFLLYEETISVDFVATEEELVAAEGKKEARIGEIYHLFAEKCPEIVLVKGRVLPS
jgi:hypothetical protein